jgi:hypothetical protein
MESLREHEPDCARYIVLVDRKNPHVSVPDGAASVVWAEDLGIEYFEFVAFSYDVLELNTNIKPRAICLLLEHHDVCVYLDPDIRVYQPLVPVWEALQTASVALTPHMLAPVFDDARPSERDLLRFGIFNLGFVGVAATDEGRELLRWWENRCLTRGFQAPADGLFVDQKFMDLVPGYFRCVAILRHPGLNVAYWNLHERTPHLEADRWRVAGQDLVFVHFSGFIYRPKSHEVDEISKYPNRISLVRRPELRLLFDDYRAALLRNGYESFINIPYSFAAFDNGMTIPRIGRRVAALGFAKHPPNSPFSADGPLYAALSRARLLPRAQWLASAGLPPGPTAAPSGRLWRVVEALLRALLRFGGVRRYELMLRLMTKLGSDLNHGFLLDRRPE